MPSVNVSSLFLTVTSTTDVYTLSLHEARPASLRRPARPHAGGGGAAGGRARGGAAPARRAEPYAPRDRHVRRLASDPRVRVLRPWAAALADRPRHSRPHDLNEAATVR